MKETSGDSLIKATDVVTYATGVISKTAGYIDDLFGDSDYEYDSC
ncbi:MAG: hypothetical protein Q8O46_01630 [bacterium]|nr:hypothetical protein [bacterium]